jgi:hypothetical protein
LQQANDQYFRFDLTGAIAAGEPVVIDLVDGSSTGDAGIGINSEQSTRKVVALLPISLEGLGGRLILPFPAKSEALEIGHVLAWPAFLDARAHLPGGGRVRALAVHAFGPVFR